MVIFIFIYAMRQSNYFYSMCKPYESLECFSIIEVEVLTCSEAKQS